MTLAEYKTTVTRLNFIEIPPLNLEHDSSLGDIVDFDDADRELKIYLVELIFARTFHPAGALAYMDESHWFIDNFLAIYTTDPTNPALTLTIRQTLFGILQDRGTERDYILIPFMLKVVEMNVKRLLGFDANKCDCMNKRTHRRFTDMTLGEAINRLKNSDLPIAASLRRIDCQTNDLLKESAIPDWETIQASLSDRLTFINDFSLFGFRQGFYAPGKFLAMFYILLYLFQSQDDQ
ncbi:MAG: hypothetical protein J0I84_07460 [Terrimonas sp.]|nr:hypothetical protein [Terrimonas sp.]OJY97939.1 MAG: hypothetical protein BGP13_09745 [Sphingobacteriales bacterium 40-81]